MTFLFLSRRGGQGCQGQGEPSHFPKQSLQKPRAPSQVLQGSLWAYLKSWGLGFEILKQQAGTLQNYHLGGYQSCIFAAENIYPMTL